MKKYKFIVITLLLLTMPIMITKAGVTDIPSGNIEGEIIRQTKTNYFSEIVFEGTFTNSTGKKETFNKKIEEFSGNNSSSKFKNEVKKLKEEFTSWAKSKGANKISVKNAVADNYYYDAHDEISQCKSSCLKETTANGEKIYYPEGTVVINTILDKHTTYIVKATAKIENTTENKISFIEGENQTITIGGNNSARFVLDADYSLFKDGGKIYINDKLLDSNNYTSESGSTIIILSSEYLNTLTAGEYTIKVTFNNNVSANTNFNIVVEEIEKETITDTNQKITNQKEDSKKQDNNNLYIIIAAIIIVIISIVTGILFKKKRLKK